MKPKSLISLALAFSVLSTAPLTAFAAETIGTAQSAPANQTFNVSTPASSPTVTAETASIIPASTASPSPIRITMVKQVEGKKQRTSKWLGQRYEAYTLAVQNTGKTPLLLLAQDVSNAIAPEDAYHYLRESPGRQFAGEMVIGLIFAPLTFGLSLALTLVITGPLTAALSGSHNKKILQYVSRFPGKMPLDIIPPGDVRQMNVLVVTQETPNLQLSVQDLASKAVFTAQVAP